MSVMTK